MKSSAYSPHYEKLRVWLKAKREDQGLSLRAAGDKMQRHHSVIGKMEQDRRKIDIVELVEYCKVLGADPHEALDILISSIDNQLVTKGQIIK